MLTLQSHTTPMMGAALVCVPTPAPQTYANAAPVSRAVSKLLSQYPVAPLYGVGEEVWVAVGSRIEGPFEVISSDSSCKYKLKHKSTGQERVNVVEGTLREKR